MIYGATRGRNHIEVKEITITSDKLPAAFDGYRIVMFSDLHTGNYGPVSYTHLRSTGRHRDGEQRRSRQIRNPAGRKRPGRLQGCPVLEDVYKRQIKTPYEIGQIRRSGILHAEVYAKRCV